MSKFDSPLAEAAYAVANHGFAEEEFGSVTLPEGWNALVDLTPTVLLNLDETDLFRTMQNEGMPFSGYLVWVREDSQGFVSVVEFGSDEGTRSGSDLVNEAFDKARDEHDPVYPEDEY